MASSGSETVHIPTSEELEALGEVWHHTFSFITSMSLKCAVELGIPDAIHNNGSAMTVAQLAAALSIPTCQFTPLRRLMRILVHNGCFARASAVGEEEIAYALTPVSHLLVHSKQSAVPDMVLMQLDPLLFDTWFSMSTWLRGTSPTAFEALHGQTIYDAIAGHPEFPNKFQPAVGRDSRLAGELLVKTHPELFDGAKSLVDVAGCMGTLAAAVAEAFPHIKCSVLELPPVAAKAAQVTGTRENLVFVGGDMFERIPSADLLVLKWVLMTWNDEKALKILKKCREAIKPYKEEGGKVVVIDMVLDDGDRLEKETEVQLMFDVLTTVMTGGMQREEHEWRKMFLEAGFSRYKITPFGVRSLIEVYP